MHNRIVIIIGTGAACPEIEKSKFLFITTFSSIECIIYFFYQSTLYNDLMGLQIM